MEASYEYMPNTVAILFKTKSTSRTIEPGFGWQPLFRWWDNGYCYWCLSGWQVRHGSKTAGQNQSHARLVDAFNLCRRA